jgi:lysylphosphatidylglycerol synthetase-like protein (DUF2156 family)
LNLEESFWSNLDYLPLTLSTMFLGAWVAVAAVLIMRRGTLRRAIVALGLVGVPLAATLATLDGTRVAVSSSSVALLIALRVCLRDPVVSVKDHTAVEQESAVLFVPLFLLLSVAVPGFAVLVVEPGASLRNGPWYWILSPINP